MADQTLSRETIGFSEEGRPLEIIFAGHAKAQLRVFILAGQHGDEACCRDAARAFAPIFLAHYERDFAPMRLAILADANPDGAAKNTRLNACGLDLNRDHLRLESKETVAIHRFVRAWRPHLIIDAHAYPPRRRHLLAQNLLYSQDLFVDVPTHPAVRSVMNQREAANFFATMNAMLAQRGLSCERYTLVRPSGSVRHSTLHVCDARQTLALRHEVFTILLEGRSPRRRASAKCRREAIRRMQEGLFAILRWAKHHREPLMARAAASADAAPHVPVDLKYQTGLEPCAMQFKNVETKESMAVALRKYKSRVHVRKSVPLPAAYAVPAHLPQIIAILHRHGFASQSAARAQRMKVEAHRIAISRRIKRNGGHVAKISTTVERKRELLAHYHIFPTAQAGGRALAVFLEPESRYGLRRYDDLGLSVPSGECYPILRVI